MSYGETDHFAHEGNYEAYLKAAHHVDGYIRELWDYAQSTPQYKDKTTLLITTDHGRGLGPQWTSHGRKIEHAEEIWIGILGPDTPALGEADSGTLTQSQVARTVATFLGLDYQGDPRAAPAIPSALAP